MSKKDVKQIKIMVETNVSETPFPLVFSQIYNPLIGESDIKGSEKFEYPYFIESIPYPEELLENKSYRDLLQIFFNKDTFIKTIVEPFQSLKPETLDAKTIEKNIMIMLNLIFPTSYPSLNNINTSYNKYLLKTPYELKFDMGELTRGMPGILNHNLKSEYSYLKINGKPYTITEILWVNDILNEPTYKELVDKLIEYNEWVVDIKHDIQEEQNDLNQKFIKGLSDSEESESSFRITEEDIYLLKKQKQIFSKEDFEEEIKNMFNYFVANNSDAILKTSMQKISSIIDNLNYRRGDITASEFNNEFATVFEQTTFKNIENLDAENMESILDKINMKKLLDNRYASSPNPEVTKKFLKLMYLSFKKYMNSNEKLMRSRSFDSMKEYDNNIQKLIDSIKALNKIKYDTENINQGINVAETIEILFEKMKFDNSNEFKKLTTKIRQMIKLSKEIKSLILVNEYILPQNKGIFATYDTKIKNEKDKTMFAEELKKTRYEQFKRVIEAINTFYFKNNHKSMNAQLQTLMDDYFNFKNSNFKDEIISKIENIKNNKKFTPDFNKWNVSVTVYNDEKNASIKYCEIYVYMEVIEGELNSSNTSSLSCSFLDEKLSEMFKKLTSTQDNNYYVPKSNKVFNLSEIAKTDSSVTNQEIESTNNLQLNETKTGGKHRESRKNKRNKKMRKTKRYRRN